MLVPAVTGIVGLALYLFGGHPKLVECGRILFFVGALWLVSLFAHGRIHLVGPS